MGTCSIFDSSELWRIPDARTQPIAAPSAIRKTDPTVEKYKIIEGLIEYHLTNCTFIQNYCLIGIEFHNISLGGLEELPVDASIK